MAPQDFRWLTITLLIIWLMISSLSVALAGVEDIDKSLFHDGARWRGENYARARNYLVARGEEILPFLGEKAESEDWRETLFAEILISRITDPAAVESWHKSLMSLVSTRSALEAARHYKGADTEGLPEKAEEVPASHLVDALWEYQGRRGAAEKEIAAVGIQFHLAPEIKALNAVLEAVPSENALARLAMQGIVKLGNPAIPRLREILVETVSMKPSTPWDPYRQTDEQKHEWANYRSQTSRACVAAYALSQLNDRESIPLIANCLSAFAPGKVPNSSYVETLSGYLGHMKAVKALDVMLDWTVHSAVKRCYEAKDGIPGYAVLRDHLKNLGPQILPTLRQRLKATDEEGGKIVLTNLIAELSGVTGKEKEAAELREAIWFDINTADLLRLHELTGEDVFPGLSELAFGKRIRFGRQQNERVAACLAMGTLKEARAIPLLAEAILKQHEYLEKKLSERKAKEDAEPFDPQMAREAGYTFGQRDPGIALILAWGDTCILALRRIGGREAKEAMTRVGGYPEYKTIAESSLLLMGGKIDELAARLENDDRAVREQAALALLECQDERATRELLCAAGRRQGPSHDKWKEYALSSRKEIKPLLRDLAKSENVRERVLAEAMILEIESPEKAEVTRSQLKEAVSRVSSMHMIRIGMIEGAGRGVAKIIDENCLPLVEAACLFGRGVIRRGVAAFALAEFKKPESMYVLAESFNMGSWGGSSPAALALADYGEEGAELAAKAPPPAPGEYDTGLRMTRHRTGVRVLAETKDIRGVEEIIKGLETLEKDKSLDLWSHRMGIYLSAAERFDDQRLVEPLLRILGTSERPERHHHAQVIELLSAYDDERLVPLFTKLLGTLNPGKDDPTYRTLYGVSVTALTRRLGEDTPDHLIKQYRESRNRTIRAAALLALGELSYPNSPAHPGDRRWSTDRFKEKADRLKVAARARSLAYPVLVEALNDRSTDVNRMAALGLTILAKGNRHDWIAPDLRAVGPLTEWLRREKVCLNSTIGYLADRGNERTGEALVAVLKSQPPTKGNTQIVFALKKMKPDGAVPVLVRNIKARAPACRRWYPGEERVLEALSAFGEEGADSLLEIFNSVENIAYRIGAARLLGEVANKDAAGPIAEFLPKMIEAGRESPELTARGNLTREEIYALSVRTVLQALAKLDAELARKRARNILLNGPQPLKPAALEVWSESE